MWYTQLTSVTYMAHSIQYVQLMSSTTPNVTPRCHVASRGIWVCLGIHQPSDTVHSPGRWPRTPGVGDAALTGDRAAAVLQDHGEEALLDVPDDDLAGSVS